jgi:hypothetical protein
MGPSRVRQIAAALVVSGLACSPIEQPVSGPVELTAEWKTVDPPEALRVAGKFEQSLCLQVGLTREMDINNAIVLANGQRHVIEGEAVDSDQETYELKVGMRSGDKVCLSRAGDLPAGPDFPAEQTIIRLRLRSVPALQVGKIWWLSFDPH